MNRQNSNKNNDHRDDFPGSFRSNPFHVPDHYFDELPGRIKSRIEQDKSRKRLFYLRPVVQKALLAAAGLALLIGLAIALLHERNDVHVYIGQFNGISAPDIEATLLPSDLDEYTLVSFILETQDFTGMPSGTDITDEEIKSYLLETNNIEPLILHY
ncbi:MAG: hypothetical protein K0B08_09095 [Bacteroidales bacterium]|nr:hypothetical protein [Bacteroidales bacterium]